MAFSDLITIPTREQIKTAFIAIAQSPPVQLLVTAWVPGDATERWIEIGTRAIEQFLSNPVTEAVRGFFLELATDPGDPGDLSADQTPRPGWLSALGLGWYGVPRGERTFAAGFVTLTNTGSTVASFAPFDLTFQRTTAGPDGGFPTYRNTEDDALYVDLGGTITLAPGASVEIPAQAEQIGEYANAAPGQVAILVTQSFGVMSVSNDAPLLGSEREDRDLYITRCKLQSAAASPNGPADAYRYACTTTTAVDENGVFTGVPLPLYDGSGSTTVNRVYVSTDSDTTDVTIYLANPGGPATPVEVSSANGNIWGIPIVADDGVIYNENPIGVAPDIATLGPTVADAKTGAPGPAAAISAAVGPLKGTAKIKLRKGETAPDLIRAVHEAIGISESEFFASPEEAPIGGRDPVAGTGYLYKSDIQTAIETAYPRPINGLVAERRLYAVTLSSPILDIALSIGAVGVYVGPPTVTAAGDNGGGLVRLTLSDATALTTGTQIQLYDSVTTGGLVLDGVWTVTNISPTQVDLQGSTWTGSFNSTKLALIILTVVA